MPMGKEFISGDLHVVNAQVADMFEEDQQRDSGVRHRNRHLDGALFHVLRTCSLMSMNEWYWLSLDFKEDGRDHDYQVTAT